MPLHALLTILRAADTTAEIAESRARAFCETLDALSLRRGDGEDDAPARPLRAALHVAAAGVQRTIGGYLIPVVADGVEGDAADPADPVWRADAEGAAAAVGLTVVSVRTV